MPQPASPGRVHAMNSESTGKDHALPRFKTTNHVCGAPSVCSQCGLCEAVCPKEAISLSRDAEGNFYPQVDKTRCAASCHLCSMVCAGEGIDWPELHSWRFGEKYQGNERGVCRGIWAAHAVDPALRARSASGGSVSTLLCRALDTGMIDGAVVSKLDGLVPSFKIATTKEEILDSAGSVYLSNPVLSIARTLKGFKGRVAVVGLPCHIASLMKAVRLKVVRPERIGLTISLICGRTASLGLQTAFMSRMGMDPDKLESVRMRGDGWPGTFRYRLTTGEEKAFVFPHPVYMSMWKFYQYTPPYCLLCSDPLGILADITAGDAWLPEFSGDREGRSLLITRTEAGEALLAGAAQEGLLQMEPLSPEKVYQAQRQQIYGKYLNQKNMRRVFGFAAPLFSWPMPEDKGMEIWPAKTGLRGLAYALFQFVNCACTATPRLRWVPRLMPLVTLTRVLRWMRKRKGGGRGGKETG